MGRRGLDEVYPRRREPMAAITTNQSIPCCVEGCRQTATFFDASAMGFAPQGYCGEHSPDLFSAADRVRLDYLAGLSEFTVGTDKGIVHLRVNGKRLYCGKSFREVVDRAREQARRPMGRGRVRR